LSTKASFALFQWAEKASGRVAAPTSPIAPDTASGAISIIGIPVDIKFFVCPVSPGCCAKAVPAILIIISAAAMIFLSFINVLENSLCFFLSMKRQTFFFIVWQ
jgi:hypothetical protein